MSNNAAATAAAIWQKEKWIKDILAKSGTELTEIKQELQVGGNAMDDDAAVGGTTSEKGEPQHPVI